MIAALAALLLWMLFVPLPRAATAWLMDRSSAWLLSDYESGALPVRTSRKLMGLWLQQSIVAHLSEAQELPEGLGDAERVAARLTALKPMLISHPEFAHLPVNAPVAFAGLGWCDGINGFGALLLSRDFGSAEIVAIVDAEIGGAHSIGRVWSDEYGDWIYFDVWADEVSVFRSRPGRPAEFLSRTRLFGMRHFPAENAGVVRRLYDRAHRGWPHNRVQPTLGGYLFHRAMRLVGLGEPEAPPEVTAAAATLGGGWNVRDPTPNRTVASAAYLQARFHHLLGQAQLARENYARVVAAERGRLSTYGHAARIFIGRIDAAAAAQRRRQAQLQHPALALSPRR